MSSPTVNKLKPINNSAARDHLLHCNYFFFFFENFSILADENKKIVLQIRESFLIIKDKPLLNINISFAPLFLFNKAS